MWLHDSFNEQKSLLPETNIVLTHDFSETLMLLRTPGVPQIEGGVPHYWRGLCGQKQGGEEA